MLLMTKLEFDFLFSLLVKEGASDKEKCQLFHKNVAEGKKDGRNKERRAKIQSEANSKSPLEICQNIKNKQIRIAMRCLLRNREQVKFSKIVSGSNTGLSLRQNQAIIFSLQSLQRNLPRIHLEKRSKIEKTRIKTLKLRTEIVFIHGASKTLLYWPDRKNKNTFAAQ